MFSLHVSQTYTIPVHVYTSSGTVVSKLGLRIESLLTLFLLALTSDPFERNRSFSAQRRSHDAECSLVEEIRIARFEPVSEGQVEGVKKRWACVSSQY